MVWIRLKSPSSTSWMAKSAEAGRYKTLLQMKSELFSFWPNLLKPVGAKHYYKWILNCSVSKSFCWVNSTLPISHLNLQSNLSSTKLRCTLYAKKHLIGLLQHRWKRTTENSDGKHILAENSIDAFKESIQHNRPKLLLKKKHGFTLLASYDHNLDGP